MTQVNISIESTYLGEKESTLYSRSIRSHLFDEIISKIGNLKDFDDLMTFVSFNKVFEGYTICFCKRYIPYEIKLIISGGSNGGSTTFSKVFFHMLPKDTVTVIKKTIDGIPSYDIKLHLKGTSQEKITKSAAEAKEIASGKKSLYYLTHEKQVEMFVREHQELTEWDKHKLNSWACRLREEHEYNSPVEEEESDDEDDRSNEEYADLGY